MTFICLVVNMVKHNTAVLGTQDTRNTLIFDFVLVQEFIVHTPHPLAQKYWITNGRSKEQDVEVYAIAGAVHAKHVVVMAQLMVKGKNEGIHAILVRMRDNDLKTIPGVTIEDMGYKMGLNGVDNAKLSFDNVRVPRTALLNR